ncbi:hypothetical protein DXH95_11790 [Sphingorhabdus pulchriflava]|uniref:DUF2306 domain-containing protein n=1 Tax=Sphingorhabdus pulchriflava TaxID=2292257 RepID=A0A371B510_9SPHN|nr:hypothetical protein [Sphingorhabdus pulchriflava]RDV02634.1 hypothetical protein DXH95_11790 [Sphingorhabdus pulchriflava]
MPTDILFPPLLVAHIAMGAAALVSGLVAMASRKGATGLHERAGQIYFGTMIGMAASAVLLTSWEPDRLSMTAGIWTIYLVLTSWSAARSKNGAAGPIEKASLPLALLATALFLDGGIAAYRAPDGNFQSMSHVGFWVFGGLAALSVVFDLYLFWRGKLQPRQRTARHLWRMVTAYFLAATSLFLGQQDDVFPFMQGSPILLIPSLATLAYLVYWAMRVRFVRNWMGVPTTRKAT